MEGEVRGLGGRLLLVSSSLGLSHLVPNLLHHEASTSFRSEGLGGSLGSGLREKMKFLLHCGVHAKAFSLEREIQIRHS